MEMISFGTMLIMFSMTYSNKSNHLAPTHKTSAYSELSNPPEENPDIHTLSIQDIASTDDNGSLEDFINTV